MGWGGGLISKGDEPQNTEAAMTHTQTSVFLFTDRSLNPLSLTFTSAFEVVCDEAATVGNKRRKGKGRGGEEGGEKGREYQEEIIKEEQYIIFQPELFQKNKT